MRKIFLLMTSLIALSITTNAQKGTNQLSIGAEVGLPTGDFGEGTKTGFGGSLKALFGISPSGQITATTGYTSFSAETSGIGVPSGIKASIAVIPVLAGYRHNFSGFYIEPQAGMGIYRVRASFQGNSESDSETKFTWAAGLGYAKNAIDVGVRYQSGEFDDGSISFVGVRVAYNFSLGGR